MKKLNKFEIFKGGLNKTPPLPLLSSDYNIKIKKLNEYRI